MAQYEKTRRVSELDVERFGLLTIITLGEIFVSVVAGLTSHHPSHLQILFGIGGVVAAIIMWLLYFDFVSKKSEPGKTQVQPWIFLHLPLTLSIITTGVAIKILIKSPEAMLFETKALFISSLAIFTICIISFRQYIAWCNKIESE